jgi:DNA polymerase-1
MIVQTLEQMKEVVDRATERGIMFYDLETTGLDPYNGDKTVGIAILVPEGCDDCKDFICYIPLRHDGNVNVPLFYWFMLAEWFLNKDNLLINWHTKFDINVTEVEGLKVRCRVLDVQLAAHMVNENNKPFKLKIHGAQLDPKYAEAEERLADAGEKAGIRAKAHMASMPFDLVSDYAMQDVVMTKALMHHHLPRLRLEKTHHIWIQTGHYSRAIGSMEFHGVKLDVQECKRRVIAASKKIKDLRTSMFEIVGHQFNPNSVPQLCNIFGVTKGPGCTDEDALNRMRHPLAPILLEYRHWNKSVTSYYSPFVAKADPKDRLHCGLHVAGTISSRLASSNPNLQAVTAPDEDDEEGGFSHVREVIVAEEGYDLVEADLNQAELRLMGHYSQAPFLLRAYLEEGRDVHTETAQLVGIPRPQAKRINFGIVYGLGAPGLSGQLKISEKKAAEMLQVFHSRAPEIKKFYAQCEYYARNNGHILMWTGRRRHFQVGYETRKACSNIIQGGVAEILRIAIQRIYDLMLDQVLPDGRYPRMVLTVHDSILFEIPTGWSDYWIPKIKEAMEWFDFSIPVVADIKIGKRWGSPMKKVDVDQIPKGIKPSDIIIKELAAAS